MAIFKERLRELREERNLTQSEMAKVLTYGYCAISNYESGRNEPSINNLIKLANFFDVSVDYLIGLSNIKAQENKIKINYDEFTYAFCNELLLELEETFQNVLERYKANMDALFEEIDGG